MAPPTKLPDGHVKATFQLTPRQAELLTRLVAIAGGSKSDHARRALDRYLDRALVDALLSSGGQREDAPERATVTS